jgi:hypothetical protein
MTPAKHRMGYSCHGPHGALRHLDGPSKFRTRSLAVRNQRQARLAFKVAVDRCHDQAGGNTLFEVDGELYSKRQRCGDGAMGD